MVASSIMYSLSWSLANSLKVLLENAALRPSIEALVDDVQIPETLRKIAPRNAGAKPEQNRFDKQTIIRRRASYMAFASGQRILDPVPLVIA